MKFLLVCLMFFSAAANAEQLVVKMKSTSTMYLMQNNKHLHKNIYMIDGDLAKLQADPNVEYAEPNVKFHIMGFPVMRRLGADTDANKAWGVDKIQASKMWDQGFKGDGIRIAVIDTGVDGSHPELAGKVEAGFNAIDGTDNSMDDNSHGTHVSGTIAGNTVGVAPNVTIVPVKFIDADGSGTLANAVKAISWAMAAHVQIMSNSWGGGSDSKAMREIIKEATDAGIYFVVAAGNESNNNDKYSTYPAAYSKDMVNVMSIAATDSKDVLAPFSNYGPLSTLLAAPGVQIYSSVPGGKYDTYSGTSMATPHVAAAMALILQKNSQCGTPTQCIGDYQNVVPKLKTKVQLSSVLQFK